MSSFEFGILSLAATVRGPWLEQRLGTCRDLSALTASHPMMAAVIDRVDTLVVAVAVAVAVAGLAERGELPSAGAAIEVVG